MSDDPVRLVDAESEAPEVLRLALRGGGSAAPSSAQLDALASKLGPLLGAAAGGAAAGAAASSTAGGSAASGGAGLSIGAKVVAGVVLVGALAGGGAWLAERDGSPAPAAKPAATAAGRAVTPGAPAEPALPAPPAAEPPALDAPSRAAPGSAKPPAAAAIKESELLEAAQRALGTNPERALALTQTHRQRFPNGALAQEREVIAIEALSRLGRKNDAKRQSEAFEKTYPGSAHQRKVESAVEP
jgi:hypothetical protein